MWKGVLEGFGLELVYSASMGVMEHMGVSLRDMLGLCSLGFDQHLERLMLGLEFLNHD